MTEKSHRVPKNRSTIAVAPEASVDIPARQPAKTVIDATTAQIQQFFARQQKTVVTFVGYSGAGYNDQAGMLGIADRLLDGFDPSQVLVNIGATPDGIGAIYRLAKQRGFTTTGIVSTQAKKYQAELSDCVDHVFYVADDSWGGFGDDGVTLSPTSTAMVGNSDLLVGIGGGEVARDELIAARRQGRQVRYYPADMDHDKARAKARKQNLPEPTSFASAADGIL
ncbi:MAG: hypothetical protein KDI82_02690 [Gammaproteobacteria bacterium]|nr:hypothetical protein [Gammaproteobacteria bacterium]